MQTSTQNQSGWTNWIIKHVYGTKNSVKFFEFYWFGTPNFLVRIFPTTDSNLVTFDILQLDTDLSVGFILSWED